MSEMIQQIISRLRAAEERLQRLEAQEEPTPRGWRDEFLGRAIHEQYDVTDFVGATSQIALLDGEHGGIIHLRGGNAAGNYANLWLGDSADGHRTLDADEGWMMLLRTRPAQIVSINVRFGTADSTLANDVCQVAFDTNTSANWLLITRTGGGAWNTVDSGVAVDTNYHTHRIEVYPITGGRQVDHYLDGALINTTDVSVPTAVLTAVARCMTRTNANRNLRIDYLEVVPR